MNTNTQKNIDKKDIDTLNALYKKMFAGLSVIKWAKQHSCGRGWQNAIKLCGAILDAAQKKHNKNNPAVEYMMNLHNKCKKSWSRTIMTHDNRDKTIDKSPEELKHMARIGINMVNNATKGIEEYFNKYNLRVKEQEKTTQLNQIKKRFLITQMKQFGQHIA